MNPSGHSYGPLCPLQSGTNPFVRRASTISDLPPKVRAQFFYTSALPIDDPLSPLPALSTSSSSTSSKVPPRPFSARDNAALEEAWQGLQRAGRKESLEKSREEQKLAEDHEIEEGTGKAATLTNKDSRSSHSVTKSINLDHIFKALSKEKANPQHLRRASAGASSSKEKSKLSNFETASQISSTTSGTDDGSRTGEAAHLLLCDDPDHLGLDEAITTQPEELAVAREESDLGRATTKSHRSPFHGEDEAGTVDDRDKPKLGEVPFSRHSSPTETPYGSSPSEKLTTGTPFIRAPSRERGSISSAPNSTPSQTDGAAVYIEDDRPGRLLTRSWLHRYRSSSHDTDQDLCTSSSSPGHGFSSFKEIESHKAYIPVGISRLHLVELPDLQMKPIYWSPLNDISSVIRGTWFYIDTMLPVEPEVAALLEDGYIYNKPWTQTWQDELNSCVEAGAEGEAKAVHRLWPNTRLDESGCRPRTAEDGKAVNQLLTAISVNSNTKNKTDSIAAEAETDSPRKFANSSVIYIDATDAQILQPSHLPSSARGRTPIAAVRKGRHIGIAVGRGFDYKAWEKLHPPKKSVAASKAQEGATVSRSGTAATTVRRESSEVCSTEEKRVEVTDLVLVIHGIGQKLSERVESFNFTHSINDFRRQVNVELGTDIIRAYLRDDLGGIMVLPINWRSTLTFDDGQNLASGVEKNEGPGGNQYTLKDITPETIPAVRNLISDVMLDIPYYLSHHKPRMIEAVIKEANRVYRLWCRNNPGFEKTGKVHLIAHSLGSVMALDILSKQPTKLPKQLGLTSDRARDNMFEFDTKNLFLCGSPAGFFLLLNKAILIPRKGREKAGFDASTINDGVTGDVGTYGCLAVDNIYNIMHYNDPIAYRLNAAVDTDYAASLLPATVPTYDKTLLQSLTTLFRPSSPSPTLSTSTNSKHPPHTTPSTPTRPAPPPKLPSTIELETHDFGREQRAETRMYRLNDNGQIDFYLASGGGPLEIQYLNMLGAHSSYWTLRDFVRLVVLEVGRGEGREGCLGAMKAVKRGVGRR